MTLSGSHSNPLNLSLQQRQKIYDAYTQKNVAVIDLLTEKLQATDIEEQKVQIGKNLNVKHYQEEQKKPKEQRVSVLMKLEI